MTDTSPAAPVAFDLDGLLVDSHETMGRAVAVARAEVVRERLASAE